MKTGPCFCIIDRPQIRATTKSNPRTFLYQTEDKESDIRTNMDYKSCGLPHHKRYTVRAYIKASPKLG